MNRADLFEFHKKMVESGQVEETYYFKSGTKCLGDSRLHIIVDEPEQWNLLRDVKLGSAKIKIDIETLISSQKTCFTIGQSEKWSCKYKTFKTIFEKLCSAFQNGDGQGCIIVGDTDYYYPHEFHAFWYVEGKKYEYNTIVDKDRIFFNNRALHYIGKTAIEDTWQWLCYVGDLKALEYRYTIEKTSKGYKLNSYLLDEEEVYIPTIINGKANIVIAPNCFSGKKMSNLIVSFAVYQIGAGAFRSCSNLNRVELDGAFNLRSLPEGAFEDCYSLNRIHLFMDSYVDSIRVSTFEGCPLLSFFTDIFNIGFKDSRQRVSIYSEDEIDKHYDRFNYSVNISGICSLNGEVLLYAAGNNKYACIINDEIEEIDENAFYSFKYVRSIEIGKSLSYINESNYEFMKELRSFNVSEDNPFFSSESGCLFDKRKETLIKVPQGIEKKKLVIPDSVKTILPSAFGENYNIEEVVLPSDLEYDDELFEKCWKRNSIYSFLQGKK